jgi:hypothetical protein
MRFIGGLASKAATTSPITQFSKVAVGTAPFRKSHAMTAIGRLIAVIKSEIIDGFSEIFSPHATMSSRIPITFLFWRGVDQIIKPGPSIPVQSRCVDLFCGSQKFHNFSRF